MKCPNCQKSLWFLRTFCPFCNTSISSAPRPKSVTVVCWVFIALSCIGLLRVGAGALVPEFRQYYSQLKAAHPIQYASLFAFPILIGVSSAFALLGHNWARWLLLGCLGCLVVGSAWPWNLRAEMVDLLWFVVAGFYLFRPRTKAFFTGPGPIAGTSGPD